MWKRPHGKQKELVKDDQCDYRKPFVCNQCSYECTIAGNLKKHKQRHTGGKLFSCNHCNFKCALNVTIDKDCLIHIGEKYFGCKKENIGHILLSIFGKMLFKGYVEVKSENITYYFKIE